MQYICFLGYLKYEEFYTPNKSIVNHRERRSHSNNFICSFASNKNIYDFLECFH